jgi:phage gpG-like protein
MAARGLQVQLVTTGIKSTLKRLRGLSDRAKDLRPIWPKVADDWARMNKLTFQRDGASSGWTAWEPISPEWAAWKSANGFDSAILRQTGTLKNSLIKRSDGNFIFQPTKQGVRLGTTVKYASFHEKGRGVPQRELLRNDSKAEKRWAKIIERYVVDGVT